MLYIKALYFYVITIIFIFEIYFICEKE